MKSELNSKNELEHINRTITPACRHKVKYLLQKELLYKIP
jgi:hypothetical protein